MECFEISMNVVRFDMRYNRIVINILFNRIYTYIEEKVSIREDNIIAIRIAKF